MSYNVKHRISLATAIELTSRFRNSRPADLPICETFSKAAVLALLNTPQSAFLRIYLGKKENGDVCAVLVAADNQGHDLLPEEQRTADEPIEPLILEDAIRCPELCPPPSPLNE
jgi:hypothetical protein